jgi:Allene oxide cyclase barrel like domain
MTRLLTLVVLGIALVSTLSEAKSIRIHVIAEIVKTTVIGGSNGPEIGDRTITTVVMFDEHEKEVGTGTGNCTIISLPPQDTLLQCLLTSVFDNRGQIIFGAILPPPTIEAVGHLGILGGTGDFRTARGEVTLVVLTTDTQDATFDIEIDSERRHGKFTAQ